MEARNAAGTGDASARGMRRFRSHDAPRSMRRLFYSMPPKGIALLCGVLICLMAGLDYVTGVELHLFALYFLPVSLAAWFGTRVLWLCVATLSAITAVLDPMWGGHFSSTEVLYGNLLTQLAGYAFVGALTEMVRRQNLRDQWLLSHDLLTGLLNKLGFRRRLESDAGMVARYHRPLTIAYLDLDNFKSVNDTRGHKAGDQVLALAAHVIELNLRSTDAAARVGGDEFALLLPETNAEGARALLERLRSSLEAEMRSLGLGVTASVGAICFDSLPGNLDDSLSYADSQMYAMKSSGKNRVQVLDLMSPMQSV